MGLLLTEEESRAIFFEHKTQGLEKAIPKPGKIAPRHPEPPNMMRIYNWFITNIEILDIHRKYYE